MIGLGLAAIPQKLLAEAVGFVIETVIVVAVTWHLVDAHYETQIAADKEAAAQVTAKAAVDAQNETSRRVTEQQLIAKNAQLQASQAAADAASAVASRDSLRVQLAAYVSASRSANHSSPATGGTPVGDPIGLLAEMLSETDDFAQRAASEADANRIAGLACESAYDSLVKK